MKLGMCLLVWVAGFWIAGEANAQWFPYAARPVRSFDRWLGVGYSGGYHTNNPGPDSDYYQPYSDLHSGLRNWQPTDSHVPQLPEEAPQEWRAPEEFPGGNESGAIRGAPAWQQVGDRRQVNSKSGNEKSEPFGWSQPSNAAEAKRPVRVKSERKLR